jgi:hypothetical protein
MRLRIIAMCLALCGCGEVRELAKTEIVVHAPRAEVFDTAFDVDDIKRSIPLVSNSGTDQLFEMTINEHSPGWSRAKPAEVPFAKEVKVKMTLEDRREASLRYAINGNDVKTGVVWHFEDMDGGRTKVSFDLLPLEGDRTEGLTLNQLELRMMARNSLDKIERMAKERGGGTVDSSDEG